MGKAAIFVFIALLLTIYNYGAYAATSPDDNSRQYLNNVTIYDCVGGKVSLKRGKKGHKDSNNA